MNLWRIKNSTCEAAIEIETEYLVFFNFNLACITIYLLNFEAPKNSNINSDSNRDK